MMDQQPPRTSGWRSKVAICLCSTLLCVFGAEVSARLFWRFCCRVPLANPDRILYAYYPALAKVDRERPSSADEYYDILLLGASTFHRDWSRIEENLYEQLAKSGHRKVRIYNLSRPAHTIRDSWLEYAALGSARFDMVMIYHGMNEARLNNAPPDVFRDDFGHYAWYEIINALSIYQSKARFALPYTLRFLALRVMQSGRSNRYVPKREPRKDWLEFGGTIRSAVPFKANLEAILDTAARRGDPIMLFTFATHLSQNYSLDAFKNKLLDYGRHSMPMEVWGKPEHVMGAVALHNRILVEAATRRANVLFVDQSSLIPKSAAFFNDPCHLTPAGSVKFVQNLLPVLLPVVGKRTAQDRS